MKKAITAVTILIITFSFLASILPGKAAGETTVTIYGKGKAHGVGMSMAGVYGMAKEGYNYKQISTHYYPNTSWSTRDDNTVIQAKDPDDGKWYNITVKDYLYRLAEEPEDWPTEGLRSLMIAARSYLWYKIERYGKISEGQYWRHDLDPTKRPNNVAAVNATANKILTYNNKSILAAYSSSAGGYTAKMSEVWGGSDSPYPYLTNRDSHWDTAFSNTYQWKQVITASTIQKAYPSIGVFKSLEIASRTSADVAKSRVKTITINGTAGSVKDTGWNFKSKTGILSNYFWLTPWPSGEQTNPATPKLYINASAKKVKRGRPIRIYGRILPSQSGVVMLRYKRGRSKWKTLRRLKVSSSKYSMKVRISRANKYVFSIRMGTSVSRQMTIYGTR